jgi:hypothetical protein
MALKRAVRGGQSVRLPLLCDPDYRAGVLTRLTAADDRGAREVERVAIADEEARFALSLDPTVLLTPCADVTHVVVRGLSGSEVGAADDEAMASGRPFAGARADGIIARGLVRVDGFDFERRGGLYPVADLADAVGAAAWSELRAEIYARILRFSDLGESVASSSAPSSGGAR